MSGYAVNDSRNGLPFQTDESEVALSSHFQLPTSTTSFHNKTISMDGSESTPIGLVGTENDEDSLAIFDDTLFLSLLTEEEHNIALVDQQHTTNVSGTDNYLNADINHIPMHAAASSMVCPRDDCPVPTTIVLPSSSVSCMSSTYSQCSADQSNNDVGHLEPQSHVHHRNQQGNLVSTLTNTTTLVSSSGSKRSHQNITSEPSAEKNSNVSGTNSNKKKKLTAKQKADGRRERNREHAKKSRLRKKNFVQTLQQSVIQLKEENDYLRASIRQHVDENTANAILLRRKNLVGNSNNSGVTTASTIISSTAPYASISPLSNPNHVRPLVHTSNNNVYGYHPQPSYNSPLLPTLSIDQNSVPPKIQEKEGMTFQISNPILEN